MRAVMFCGASLLMMAQANAQPTVVSTTSPLPPPVFRAESATARAAPPVFSAMQESDIPVRPMQVMMRLGQRTLWNGVLNVGGRAPARVSLSEAVEQGAGCEPLRGYGSSANRQIEISLSASRSPRQRDGFPIYSLTARYVRPPENSAQCDGSRTVAMDQRFMWESNDTLTFSGDGGLSVTISRP
ncbi:hypothetical protein [Sphingobium algorifonticola]|uniref:Uncharacterized protein n=1 Tax=Sphingobium algorifonticola TaxID=2008318 RepID=A0A437J9B2_9SPHN|nr:hypothetical protein [Sphingobium algorifonticola]RVT42081.1 hypothetical protein ENE74_07570 [Sphingobium algorifonticola]